ncbi:MAG: secretion system protein E, partial [Halobacterium sp.]
RTLFQVMSTGHTTYTTFHADNVGEVLKRFTTEPINVSKTLFTALDLVSVQSQTRVRGQKVRRNRSITEINRYDPENDEINVNDVFQWEPEDDTYRQTADSSTLQDIKFDRGWTQQELDAELQERRVLLAYLIKEGLNEYAQVAATAQAYINDPETILTLVANDQLPAALEDLRGMESVLIDVDPKKEEMVPRPDPTEQVLDEAEAILEEARSEGGVLAEYEGKTTESLAMALSPEAAEQDVVADARDLDAADLEAAIERVTDTDLESAVERVADVEPAEPTERVPDDLDPAVERVEDSTDDHDDGFGSFEPAAPPDDAEDETGADGADSDSGAGTETKSDDEGAESGGDADSGGESDVGSSGSDSDADGDATADAGGEGTTVGDDGAAETESGAPDGGRTEGEQDEDAAGDADAGADERTGTADGEVSDGRASGGESTAEREGGGE